MAIKAPFVALSAQDKEFLATVSTFVLRSMRTDGDIPVAERIASLSDEEAKQLRDYLQALLRHRGFTEKITFVEAVLNPDQPFKGTAWKLFSSGRNRPGSHSPWTTSRWRGFLATLHGDEEGTRGRMSYAQFLEHEKVLVTTCSLHHLVRDTLLRRLRLIKEKVELLRSGTGYGQLVSIRKSITGLVASINRQLASPHNGVAISQDKLLGIVTVVMNCSTLFTTKNWDITGTISTIAGGIVLATK